MMLFNSLDMPPERDTYATLPGRYSLEAKMLSSIPPVLPILKQPGLMPPTWETRFKVRQQDRNELTNKHRYTPKQKYVWSEATYCCRANDGDTFLISNLDQFPGLSFWDAFGYDGNCVNLKTQLKQVRAMQICLNAVCFQLVFVPVGIAWSPWCCRRLSAERQS